MRKYVSGLALSAFLMMALAAGRLHAQAYKWEKTADFSGHGTAQTVLMPIVGERWRIKYESRTRAPLRIVMMDGSGAVVCHVCRHGAQQTSWLESGHVRGGVKSAALRIEGDMNGWSLVFEQYIDDIGGWELSKWRKNCDAKWDSLLEKKGMWCGEGGDEMSCRVAVSSRPWRLVAATAEKGRLKFEVLDKDGKSILADHRLVPGSTTAWFYEAGEFTVRCSSTATPWSLSLEAAK